MSSIKVHPIFKNYGYNTCDKNIYHIPTRELLNKDHM